MGISGLITASYNLVDKMLIPIAFALCLLYFFWGVAKYVRSGAESDKAVEEGKRVMVWGVVALFVLSSVWGIIYFIRSELQLDTAPTEVRIR